MFLWINDEKHSTLVVSTIKKPDLASSNVNNQPFTSHIARLGYSFSAPNSLWQRFYPTNGSANLRRPTRDIEIGMCFLELDGFREPFRAKYPSRLKKCDFKFRSWERAPTRHGVFFSFQRIILRFQPLRELDLRQQICKSIAVRLSNHVIGQILIRGQSTWY